MNKICIYTSSHITFSRDPLRCSNSEQSDDEAARVGVRSGLVHPVMPWTSIMQRWREGGLQTITVHK